MGSYPVLDRLEYDGKTYAPGGKPVTIDDDDLVIELQGLKVIGRTPVDQADDGEQEPARIRVATAPWLTPIEVGGLTFSPEFRLIEAGEIDEAQLLAMVENPSLRIEGLRVGADPVFGWEIWDDERRALTIEGLRGHIENDLEHGRPYDRVGPPSARLDANPAAPADAAAPHTNSTSDVASEAATVPVPALDAAAAAAAIADPAAAMAAPASSASAPSEAAPAPAAEPAAAPKAAAPKAKKAAKSVASNGAV